MHPNHSEIDEIASRISAWGEPVARLDDAGLLAFAAAFERVARVVGGVQTRVAGEVGSRSRPELGAEGLSRSQNFTTPAKLLSAVTRTSVSEAHGRLDLGERMRGAEQLGGLTAPEPYPAVREALDQGDLGVACAAVITRECAALRRAGVAGEVVSSAEEQLVTAARNPVLTVDDVSRLAVRVRETLDPDGLEPRAEAQREARSFTLARSADGMFRGRLALTPEDGALWLGALQALISPRTAPRFVAADGDRGAVPPESGAGDGEARARNGDLDGDGDGDGEVAAAAAPQGERPESSLARDPRTVAQKMADAATELIARAAGAPEQPRLAGAIATLNVHVDLADLERGSGPGWIDGVDEPIPMSTIERLRCHSPEVVTVFGDHGEVLHHGKARRLFSPAQNRALAARDGGCVWPGCDRPPSWCEAHHVQEWRSRSHPPGRTDIENAALLCRHHHARIHTPEWKLTMRNGVPCIIQPPWLDPAQTPVPVSRRRTAPTLTSVTNAPRTTGWLETSTRQSPLIHPRSAPEHAGQTPGERW